MSHDAKQDESVMFDKIDKKVSQELSQKAKEDKENSKIPKLSAELLMSHFESQTIFAQAIELLGSKQGDNVKRIKTKGNERHIVEITPKQNNIGGDNGYYTYKLSIYSVNDIINSNDSKDDSDSDSDESDESQQYHELESGYEKKYKFTIVLYIIWLCLI